MAEASNSQQNSQQGVQILLNQINRLSANSLEELFKTIEEIQMNFEPARDQALDKKSYWTGYAQCAEDFIKVLNARSEFVKQHVATKKLQEAQKEQESKIKALEEKLEENKEKSNSNGTNGTNGTKKKVNKKLVDKSVEEKTINLET